MNKIYRVIYNKETGTYNAVSEYAKAQGKSSSSKGVVGSLSQGIYTAVRFAYTIIMSGVLIATGQVAFGATGTTPTVGAVNADGNNVCYFDKDSQSIICGDDTTTVAPKVENKTAKSVALGLGAKTAGESNVALGANSSASHQSGLAIGANTRAHNSQTVAIGEGASALGETDVSIGKTSGATTSTGRNIAIGEKALSGATANNVIALGTNAGSDSTATHSVVIGTDAGKNMTSNYNTAVGYQSVVNGGSSSAFGYQATANQSQSTAIGYSADATGTYTTALGANAQATQNYATAVGGGNTADKAANATGVFSTAVGYGSKSSGRNALAAGVNSNAKGLGSTALGSGATTAKSDSVGATGAIAISATTDNNATQTTTASGNHSIAMGVSTTAQGENSIAVGKDAKANNNTSIAIGEGANTGTTSNSSNNSLANNVAIGHNASNQGITRNMPNDKGTYPGWEATAVGADTTTQGVRTTAVGYGATAKEYYASAFGYKAKADGWHALAIGSEAEVQETAKTDVANATAITTNLTNVPNANYSATGVAIGRKAVAAGYAAIAQGVNTEASTAYATAIGANARATKIGTTAIGAYATAEADSSVALGRYSHANREKLADTDDLGADPLGALADGSKKGSLTWQSNAGAVSVGSSAQRNQAGADIPATTRQIVNLAAGSQDTDAVNVAQLKAAGFKLDTAATTDGELGAKTVGATKETDDKIQNGETLTVEAGKNIKVTQTGGKVSIATKDEVDFNSVTSNDITVNAGGSLVLGSDVMVEMGDNVVTGVADGEVSASSSDAVNGSQLFATNTKVDANTTNIKTNTDNIAKGLNFGANDQSKSADKTINRQLGETINIKGGITDKDTATSGENVITRTDGDTINIELAKDVKFDSAYFKDTGGNETVVAGSGIAIKPAGKTDADIISLNTNGLTMGGQKIKNLADGEVSANSKDAINGSQLFNAQNNIANYLGGGAKMENGQMTAPAYTINKADGKTPYTTPAKNVGDALTQLNSYVNEGFSILDNEGGEKAKVQPQDKVQFVNGKGTTSTVTQEADGLTKVQYDVAIDDKTIKVDADGKLYADVTDTNSVTKLANGSTTTVTPNANGDETTYTVEVNKAQVNTTPTDTADADKITINTAGKVVKPTNNTKAGNSFVTADVLADVVNNTGFNLQANGDDKSLVKSGDTVQFLNGDNIEITRKGNDITVATKKDVTFNTVTAGTGANQVILGNDGVKVGGQTYINNDGLNANDKKVTNVAPATISANSKDAVNGSQLFAQGEGVKNIIGGATTYNPVTGAYENTDIGGTGKGNIHDAIQSINTKAGVKTVVSAGDGVTVENSGTAEAPNYKVSTNVDNSTVQIVGGKISAKTANLTTGTDGKAAAGDTTSLVTANQVATAINNAGLSFSGDVADDTTNKFTRTNQQETKIVGGQKDKTKLTDNNIGVVSNGTDTLTVKLAKDINLGDTGSVKTGNTTINNDGVKVGGVTLTNTGLTAGDVKVTKDGIDAGNKKITNVANGAVTATSKDAINGSQLRNTAGDIATIIGGNASVDDEGNVTASNIGGTGKNNINDAIKASKTTVSSNDSSIKVTKTTNDTTGADNYDVSVNAQALTENAQLPVVYTKADGTKVYKVGDKFFDNKEGTGAEIPASDIIASMQNADGKTTAPTTLANVKAGVKATDAVNVSQLKGVTDALGQTINPTTGEVSAPSFVVTKTDGTKYTGATTVQGALDNIGTELQKPLTFVGDNTTTQITRTLGTQLAVKGGATGALTDNNIGVTGSATDNSLTVKLAENINLGNNGSVTTGATTINNDGVKVGDVTLTNTGLTAGDVKVTKDGINAGDKVITGVKAGANDTDAVNVSQLKAYQADNEKTTTAQAGSDKVTVKGTTTGNNTDYVIDLSASTKDDIAKGVSAKDTVDNKGLTFTGDTGTTGVKKLGDTVAVTGDANISTVATGAGVQVKLNDNITVKGVTADEAKIGGNVTINNAGINAGNTQITNLKSGLNGKTLDDIKADPNAPERSNAATIGDLATVQNNVTNITNITNNILGSNVVDDTKTTNVKEGDKLGTGANASVALIDTTNVLKDKDGKPILTTYNVSGQTEYIQNDVIQAINHMNEQGIKFFHVNNGQTVEAQAQNGEDSSASGKYATAVGYQTTASGEGAVAMGNTYNTTDAQGQAVAQRTQATGKNAIAIGTGSQAHAENTIAIGTGNVVTGKNSGAIGDPSIINGANSYSVGNNNNVATNSTFVLGNEVKQTLDNSVILGDSSSAVAVHTTATGGNYTYAGANDANVAGVGSNVVGVVSVGNDNQTRQIQNVSAGVVSASSTDAINGSQLYDTHQAIGNLANYSTNLGNRINEVEDEANAGVSSAMAMASLPQAYLPGKSMLTGGMATYNGEGAVAVGLSKLSDNGRWVLKISGSADTKGNAGGAIGAGFHF